MHSQLTLCGCSKAASRWFLHSKILQPESCYVLRCVVVLWLIPEPVQHSQAGRLHSRPQASSPAQGQPALCGRSRTACFQMIPFQVDSNSFQPESYHVLRCSGAVALPRTSGALSGWEAVQQAASQQVQRLSARSPSMLQSSFHPTVALWLTTRQLAMKHSQAGRLYSKPQASNFRDCQPKFCGRSKAAPRR